jgi:preprotein translocase subunit YajC
VFSVILDISARPLVIRLAGSPTEMRKQMGNINIGDTFTTQKSGVVGTVQEIVKNANGTSRVRLTVNGADRWTTVK